MLVNNRKHMYQLNQQNQAESDFAKLPRNSFQFISQDVDFKVVAEPVLVVRTLVKNMSDCGGQGFLKCGKFSTKKCKCRAASVLCNSRCHGKKQTDCTNF